MVPLTNSSRSEERREAMSVGFWTKRRLSWCSSSREWRFGGKMNGGAIEDWRTRERESEFELIYVLR